MTYTMPDSLRAYFSDERAVSRAVDALMPDLAGKKCPELEFDHIRDYNQALLMAAKVRADYIDMLIELWNRSFGDAKAIALLGEEDLSAFSSESTPYAIWDNSQINRHFRVPNKRDTVSLTATVDRSQKEVFLEFWNWGGDISLDNLRRDKWQIITWDGNDHLQSSVVAVSELIDEPERAIKTLHDAATVILGALGSKTE